MLHFAILAGLAVATAALWIKGVIPAMRELWEVDD